MSRLNQTAIEKLLKASDYRSFIAVLIQERKKNQRFGYSDIARRGGFSARSFPRDVVKANKRITLTSIPKMIRGLGLTADLADYFKILVEIEEIECRLKNLSDTKLFQMKETLKKRISEKEMIAIGSTDKAFVLSCIPRIYAALGEISVGSNINEIIDKTSLSESEVMEALEYMVQKSLIEKVGRRYLAKEMHINFQGLKSEIFQKHFVKTAEESIKISKNSIGSDEKLFLSSAFSVSKNDLAKLKEELRSLLLKYVDSSENPKGNKVVNLIASLY